MPSLFICASTTQNSCEGRKLSSASTNRKLSVRQRIAVDGCLRVRQARLAKSANDRAAEVDALRGRATALAAEAARRVRDSRVPRAP